MKFTIEDYINTISRTDRESYEAARKRLLTLAKPPGSLGELEDIAARLAGITREVYPNIAKKCVLVFAADNGVVAEGVASTPQSVTAAQTINMLRGLTGVAVVSKHYGSDLMVTDVGVNARLSHPDLRNKKIRPSTDNIAVGPAMTLEEAKKSVQIGIETVEEAKEKGYQVLGIGEMGIGNTTTSSAVLAALLGYQKSEISKIVGKGAGLSDEGLKRKINVIEKSIYVNHIDQSNPIDILSKVGGFDLAAMTGAYLAAAKEQIPVVIDGFISVVAALCAVRLNPFVKEYLFASHNSYEQGYKMAIEKLNLTPYLNLNMRLGEGSGCPILFGLMDLAEDVILNMATFEEADIDDDYIGQISASESFEIGI